MSVEKVRAKLGEDAELFTFKIVEGYIIVRPRQKLGTEKFAECAEKLKAVGGEYVRFNYDTKKGGHFKVKKEGTMSTVTSDQKAVLIKDAFEYLNAIEDDMTDAQKKVDIIREKLKELQK